MTETPETPSVERMRTRSFGSRKAYRVKLREFEEYKAKHWPKPALPPAPVVA